ncbi:hypothetical protein MRX96_044879 [Rhipicephalus microplus]
MALVASAPRLRNDAHEGEAAFIHKSLNTVRAEGGKRRGARDPDRPTAQVLQRRRQLLPIQPTASQASESGGESQRKKRSRLDPHVESEEAFLSRVEIKVRIPEELKPWLVDDWDLITEQKKLPCNVTVDHILADYVKQNTSVKGISSNKESAIIEVTNGLKEYFNVMLGSQLLHKFERLQYADALNERPDTPISQIYGAIHLLRLFVRLGSMLACTPLDEKSVQLLLHHIHDFLKYMARNSQLFSLNDYTIAPPDYQRKAI